MCTAETLTSTKLAAPLAPQQLDAEIVLNVHYVKISTIICSNDLRRLINN